jgi:plasmid stabilization system protein ParE
MAKEIVWTLHAVDDLENIISYLQKEWSLQVASDFIDLITHRLEIVSLQPKIGSKTSHHSKFRKLVLTKYNILIYSSSHSHLIIHRIKDTRKKK